jgi:hypothetical protein
MGHSYSPSFGATRSNDSALVRREEIVIARHDDAVVAGVEDALRIDAPGWEADERYRF